MFKLKKNNSLTVLGSFALGFAAFSGMAHADVGQNLVVNGDFESGNTGFNSQYDYVTNTAACTSAAGLLGNAGCYAVGNGSTQYNQYWTPNVTPHTSTGMFVANGSSNSIYEYRTTVENLVVGKNYVFDAWIAGLFATHPSDMHLEVDPSGPCPVDPNVEGNFYQFGALTASPTVGNWKEGKTAFRPTGDKACIRLINMQYSIGGNDFALDDISVYWDTASPVATGFAVNVSPQQLESYLLGKRDLELHVLSHVTAGSEPVKIDTKESIDIDPLSEGIQSTWTDPGRGTFEVVWDEDDKIPEWVVKFTPNPNYTVGMAGFLYQVYSVTGVPSNVEHAIIVLSDGKVYPDTDIAAPTLTTQASSPTNVNPITVTGTAVAGGTVRVYDNGDTTPVCVTTADPQGNWSCDVTLVPGANVITATVEDSVGNISPASTAITIESDQVAPPAPVITTQIPAPGPGGPLLLTGTAEANATISIYNFGKLVGTTKADSQGNWTFNGIILDDDRKYSITATATDAAGNVSQPSAPLEFSYDDESHGSDNHGDSHAVVPQQPEKKVSKKGKRRGEKSLKIAG